MENKDLLNNGCFISVSKIDLKARSKQNGKEYEIYFLKETKNLEKDFSCITEEEFSCLPAEKRIKLNVSKVMKSKIYYLGSRIAYKRFISSLLNNSKHFC